MVQMSNRVLLVPDSRPEKGFGHISRCCTLGDALRRMGGHPFLFLPYSIPGRGNIESEFPVIRGSDPVVAARRLAAKSVVLDGYGFPALYATRLSRKRMAVCAIDDLGLPFLPLQLIINPNLHASKLMYRNRSLRGPAYALLRREIIKERREKQVVSDISHIVVCMGGADPDCVSLDVLSALNQIFKDQNPIQITIVLGPSSAPELRTSLANKVKTLALEVDVQIAPRNFPQILSSADIAIVSGGVVLTESLYLGVPSLAIVLAENQREGVAAWENAGAVIQSAPEVERIKAGLLALLKSPSIRQKQSACAMRLIDGKGAQRVAKQILNL